MLRKILCGMAASALVLALIVPATAMAHPGDEKPVDQHQQVAQLNQRIEEVTNEKIEAKGCVHEGT